MTTLASAVRGVLLTTSEVGSSHTLRRESILFHQHQDVIGVFLIEDGLVKLTRTGSDGSKIILSVAGPNHVVGEECLGVGAEGYFGDSVCLTEVVGYHVPIEQLQRLMNVPELASAIADYLIQRNREFIEKIELLACHDVEHRLLHGLASLASLVKPSSDGISFAIPMTQSELASYVGATRETTSTTLGALRIRKLLTLSRRLITTVHPDILIRAANDRLAGGATT